jgi:hypothetical protein
MVPPLLRDGTMHIIFVVPQLTRSARGSRRELGLDHAVN